MNENAIFNWIQINMLLATAHETDTQSVYIISGFLQMLELRGCNK